MTDKQQAPIRFIAAIEGQLFEFFGVTKAYSYTLKSTIDLLTGVLRDGGLDDLKKELHSTQIESYFDTEESTTKVIHLFYELGAALDPRVSLKIKDCDILGMVFEFSEKSPYEIMETQKEILVSKIDGPTLSEYSIPFTRGLEHLRQGDCYQYNLTFPFDINFSNSTLDTFLAHCWSQESSVGKYASVTQLPDPSRTLFSNSPECFFNIKNKDDGLYIETLPIKGTQSTVGRSASEAWNILSKSEKDQAELYMITDLMRNDLSRLCDQWAQVVSLKERMLVPGLVHSFSHLEAVLPKETSLLKIIECLFPGGSITGAPKVRVLEIIDSLEQQTRGFYCGSTIIASRNHISGSINIRSGVLDCERGQMRYHAGGGITFKSSVSLEHQEMWDKVQSFTNLLGPCQI